MRTFSTTVLSTSDRLSALDLPDFLADHTAPGCVDTGSSDNHSVGDSLCRLVYAETQNRWLALLSDWLLARPAVIFAIVLGALLTRWVVHRLIRRATTVRDETRKPAILRPFADRASVALEATGLLSERRRQRARTMGSVLRSLASVVIFVVALSLVLGQFDVNLAPLVASAGVAGVALGFGAQSLVKDYLSGIFMTLEDQYGVGDVVDLGEASGVVENIGLRVTTVRDIRGVVWYLRNGEIIRVGNKSQGWAQVVVDLPLPFGTDIEAAQQVLAEAAHSMVTDDAWGKDVLAPPEVLGVEQVTTTGLIVRVTLKTATSAQWAIARELRRRLNKALNEAGIPSGLPIPLLGAGPSAAAAGGSPGNA